MAKVSNSKKSSRSKKAGQGASSKKSLPAYFLSLTVENVRCFGPKQTLDLSDGADRPAQWTVILGDNGVGKTTLLQGIAALETLIQPDEVLGRIGKQFFASAQLLLQRHLSGERTGSATPIAVSVSCGSLLSQPEKGRRVIHRLAVRPIRGGINLSWSPGTDPTELLCYGYGASRRMGSSSLSESGNRSACASLLLDDEALLNAEEWLLQADYAASKSGNTATGRRAVERRDQIKDVLIQLLPDVEDIRITEPSSELPNPRVEMLTPYGWVHLESLSLGYKTLIAWMVDLAAHLFERYPRHKNPLAQPAVVLVDEIDLHLHPKWQRTIMSYLSERFVNTQFIVTAHSPLIVQGAKDANIVLLRREGDHVVIDNDVKTIAGWRADQILTSGLFGLESARPPELDGLLAKRQKLLSKSRLTKKDKETLGKIEAQIGELPMGNTIEDIEAMDIIRRAAKGLKGK